ncbi:MAG: virulence factor SrfC family protein [Burkholderiaceae bacterium]
MPIPTQEQVRTQAHQLSEACSQARDWIRRVAVGTPKVAIEERALLDAARGVENQARKLASSAARRNSVGVFGPSQAGKSYLVSVLGRDRGRPLMVDFAGAQRNFIEEINPQGGKESTGLVTRFTTERGTTDREHPVELRLLSECDLVKILANSFLSDFDQANRRVSLPDAEKIRQGIASIEGRAGQAESAASGGGNRSASHLDEIAMLDISEYFESYFRLQHAELKRAGYWEALIRLGHRLGMDERIELYSMLWGGLADLTGLFRLLLVALQDLGHAAECRASMDSLLPRERSIIDVDTLRKGLASPEHEQDTVSVVPVSRDQGVDGSLRRIPRALLTALVAEVKVVVTTSPWPFFEHTDLLDFPGARSREKLIDLPSDAQERIDAVRNLLLRGKIAYLFQRYTEDRELSCMMLCMPPGNQEVKDLTALVGEWVRQTHGRSASDRSGLPCGLFMILTKFDTELQVKPGDTNDSLRSRLDVRVEASVNQLFSQEEWLQNWDGKPFRNTFLLRNPGFPLEGIFTYESLTPVIENGIASQAQERLGLFREGMSASENCRRHFADPMQAWDSAMALNDGGVARLVAELQAVMTPDLKARQLASQLAERARQIERELARFYSAGAAESRRNKDEEINGLRRKLFAAVNEREFPFRRFYQLLGALMISEPELRSLFLQTAELRLEDQAPPPSSDPLAAQEDPWAEDPWASADENAATPHQAGVQRARVHDRFDHFADRVLGAWTQQARALAKDSSALAALRMDAQMVSSLTDELVVAAQRLGLAGRIADRARTQLQSATTRFDEVADRAAGIASMLLNDFIFDLDFACMAAQERPAFPEPPKIRVRSVFEAPPMPEPSALLGLGESRMPTEQVQFMDWGVAVKQVAFDNLSFEGGRQITEEDNAALGRILDGIRPAIANTPA